jgi:hypothetical protein
MWDGTRATSLREAIARLPAAQADPGLRARMRTSTNPVLIVARAAQAPAAEFRKDLLSGASTCSHSWAGTRRSPCGISRCR